MDINEVVARALKDEKFANELRSKALQAVKNGMDSPEWDEYMAYFNTSPEDLARMKTGEFPGGDLNIGTTWTTATITTATTSVCTITTVTTVTTVR